MSMDRGTTPSRFKLRYIASLMALSNRIFHNDRDALFCTVQCENSHDPCPQEATSHMDLLSTWSVASVTEQLNF